MFKRLLFIYLLFFSSSLFSQDLDSLLTVARQTKNDSVKIRSYNKIAFSYIFSDAEKALQIIKEGKDLAEKAKFNFGLTELTNTHGIYMDVTGRSDSAGYYFSKALKLSRTYKFPKIESMCINNLGMYHWNRGDFKEAQDYFFQALKMYEAKDDYKSTSIPLNNIGLIFQEMNMAKEALKYHKKSYAVRQEFDLRKEQATSLNNIGICLKDLGRYDEALDSYQKGLVIAKSSNNLDDYYTILENIGTLYDVQKKYKEASKYYGLAINTPLELPNKSKSDIIISGKMVGVLNRLNKPHEALRYILKAEALLNDFPHFKTYSEDLLANAAETHYRLGNSEKARQYILDFSKLKDTNFSAENAKAFADLEVKYETEKKEKEILEQRAVLAEKELNLNRKNTQMIGLVVLALLITVLGYLFYKQQKLKNRQLVKEGELKEALVKIETQNKLQEQRLRISRDLHDNIGAQLTFIISSIENLQYGFKITNEKLTNKLNGISSFTRETIYELRDTIWAMNKGEISIEDLQTRISNFSDKANNASNAIQITFNIDESIPSDLKFTSIKGMNAYRIIQEAVNNAIKHAQAKAVKVSVDKVGQQVKITILDDGKGFNVNEVGQGNGINNMKKRANEIHSQLFVDSEQGKGTSITFTV